MGGARTGLAGVRPEGGVPLQPGEFRGLAGVGALCQALASREGSGDHTWRAYLSTTATKTAPAVNARDRIGAGPWYNAEGLLVAANVVELHGPESRISKETALTERGEQVPGVGDTPNQHDILTGSATDGTLMAGGGDTTCGNWTSTAGDGAAQVGHHDRQGLNPGVNSWNAVHASRGCSQENLVGTGGSGRFYCFATN